MLPQPPVSRPRHLYLLKEVPQIEEFSFFTERSLRHLIERSEGRVSSSGEIIPGNGLKASGAIVRIGRRIFIDINKLREYLTSLTTPSIDDFMNAGQWVDAESTGLCLPEYFALRDLVREHFSVLQEMRVKQLRRVLDGADA